MPTKILVVDDKQMMRDSVGATLQRSGFYVVSASDGAAALDLVARHRPAAILSDVKMPEMDGLELLGKIRGIDPQVPVVMMTAFGTVDIAVKAMKEGAFDFIQKPFEGDQLVLTMKRAAEHRRLVTENAALKSRATSLDEMPMLIGRSPIMRALAQQIQQFAHSSGTVLISGESGTGKEVVARAIHAHSPRRERIMLCVNCAALSSTLLESEIFGHEKGAFTGADALRKGRFELADGGTLLLDEISEIDPPLQAKLLRVLQERRFERVGSSTSINIDVRVVATTNRNLLDSVTKGTFRQDLYYRLNVLPIQLPPLRERKEDIPLLAEHFLANVSLREGRETKRFEDEAVQVLQEYPWPGNVRELQNICERATVFARHSTIPAAIIRPWLTVPGATPSVAMVVVAPSVMVTAANISGGNVPVPAPTTPSAHSVAVTMPATEAQPMPVGVSAAVAGETSGAQPITLEVMERQEIVRALERYNGNRRQTAEALGIGIRTLGLKLKKWKEMNLVAATI